MKHSAVNSLLQITDGISSLVNGVSFCENWSVDIPADVPFFVRYAMEDLQLFFQNVFGIALHGNGKCLCAEVRDNCSGFGVEVSDERTVFWGETPFAVMQAVVWAENQMRTGRVCALEKKNHVFGNLYPHRFATASEAADTFSVEYLDRLLHLGIDSLVFDSVRVDGAEVKRLKAMGFFVYAFASFDELFEERGFDGLILVDEPSSEDLQRLKDIPSLVLDTRYWKESSDKKALLKVIPPCRVILSFDGGQALVRENVSCITAHGSLAAAQASERFAEDYALCMALGHEVIIAPCTLGRTGEFPLIPFLPAMMQWILRMDSLKAYPAYALLESDEHGFVPSLVSDFTAAQLYTPCEESGVCLQRLSFDLFGSAEKAMLAFKKASDGANRLLLADADRKGPATFATAYPLIDRPIYDYPFDKKDVTLEVDLLGQAAADFEKAACYFATLKNAVCYEANCRFAYHILITCCNAKRWYRRLHVLQTETVDYKVRFLKEQMIKIAQNEIKNAQESAEVLMRAPYLSYNRQETLCSLDAIEAKISMTEQAIAKLKG